MKLGLIGTGMIVNDVLAVIKDINDIELIGLASTSRSFEKARQLQEDFQILEIYDDYHKMLKYDNIDTIYIGVPNHLHFEVALDCIEAGYNVICEKPFTIDDSQLKLLIKAAQDYNVILLEAITNQYLPNMMSIKNNLKKVGSIKIVSTNYSQYSSRYDAFKAGNISPVFDPLKAGGALMDLNYYNISFLTLLFGKPIKASYQANIERGIDTSGIVLLDYGTFKAIAIGAKDCQAPIMSTIQGDNGCISFNSPSNTISSYEIIYNNGKKETFNLQGDQSRLFFEFVEITKIIDNKDYQTAQEMLEHSLDTMEVITQARESARIKY